MPGKLSRRDFLASGLVVVGAALAGPAVWRQAIAAPAKTGPGPYGPLLPPDANGVRLPEGFTSRVIARSGTVVLPAAYLWHTYPDGGATFATEDGGWIYVSNSEVSGGAGGAGAIRFDRDANIVDAYPILEGTSRNCAGGPTPWGTWLSCEETATGGVWECDASGAEPAVVRGAMGTFTHESAAVDPKHKRVYLTEDDGSGRFYRFTPTSYPDLSKGILEAAQVADTKAVAAGRRSRVDWHRIADPSAASAPTQSQAPKSTPFDGGEGTWFDAGVVYFTTKGDNRVWAFDTDDEEIEIVYDDDLTPAPPLSGVDNVYVSGASGDIFVAEEGGDMQVVMITPERTVAPVLQLVGHARSEIAGPAMDPSHERFYFSSQRGNGLGMTFEITGPFRKTRTASAVRASPAVGSPSPAVDALEPETEGEPELPPDGGDRSTVVGLGAAAAATAAAIALREKRED